MDDFGMLAKDFGFRAQGKSAPMKSSGVDRRNKPTSSSTTFVHDGNDIFNDVVYGSSPKFSNNNSKSTSSISDYDSILKDSSTKNNNNNEAKSKPKSNSKLNSPVYDKPLYDDGDIFATLSQPSKQSLQSDHFDDLLGSLGRTEKAESIGNRSDNSSSSRGLDDLIPGFGSGSPASNNRRNSDPSSTSTGKINKKSNPLDDPFVVLESLSTPVASSKGVFTDPLEEISKIGKSRSTKSGVSLPSGDVFGDIDSLNGFNKSPPAYVKETNNRKKGRTEGSNVGSARSSVSREPLDESSFGYFESQPQKMPFDDLQESHQTVHDMPSVFRNTRRSFDQTTSPSSHTESMSSKSEHVHYADDIWLTVSEIPLFTPVTKAPPPSRPPPPIPTRATKSEKGSFASSARTFDNDFSSSLNSAKYSQNTNASRNKEPVQVVRDEQALDEEREREEDEREQRRVENERMKEIEREKARQAVERANREARERAASEARLKAERAAVQRAQTEARERAAVEARERAERAAAEKVAKEKAEKEAQEKAQKEVQEKAAVAKAQAEARRRAERAAVERVTAEARERAAAEARERAATTSAATKMNQQKNNNDLDSFFSTGSRPSSVPKARATSNDSATDPLSQDKRRPEGDNVRKTSSTSNFVDDLSSIFGATTPAGEFQDVEGETVERRRARLERQQRTQERAAKALAEKNQRDQQILKEQEEKQRISTTLDVEIKHWAAGKEGNLRAMLSTLQFVLWPECGWQPISLTDLITGASVKKAYRKATLCIHPDKVQQKGANLQQKYVAEKVFDILKEAWNKFNSEELF